MSQELAKWVDPEFYSSCYQFALSESGLNAVEHYQTEGVFQGNMPRQFLDPVALQVKLNTLDVSAALESVKSDLNVRCTIADLSKLLPSSSEAGWVDFGGGGMNDMFSEDETIKNRNAAPTYGNYMQQTVSVGDCAYNLISPEVEFFTHKLESCDPFAYVKLPHGLWDSVAQAQRLSEKLRSSSYFQSLNDSQVRQLGRRWARWLNPNNGSLVEGFTDDLFTLLQQKLPDNTHVGLSLKGFPTHDERLWHIPGNHDDKVAKRLEFVRNYFPNAHTFIDGTIFKRYAICGRLPLLMNTLQNRPSILVASHVFDDFAKRMQMPLMQHHAIPPKNSHAIRYKIYRELVERIQKLIISEHKPPVVIMQTGGSLAFWLIVKLQKNFPDVTFLDLGQAINIWMMDKLGSMPWLKIYADSIMNACKLKTFYEKITSV